MPGDWIKMRVDIHDQPEVIGIARRNGLNVDSVVGKLIRIWGWANRVTFDGRIPHVDRDYIDKLAQRKGFADAMVFVGWLAEDGEQVIIPHFDRHNSDSAKSRAMDAERKRAARIVSEKCPGDSRTKGGLEKRREEKRREEREIQKSAGPAFVPESDSEQAGELANAWGHYCTRRRSGGLPADLPRDKIGEFAELLRHGLSFATVLAEIERQDRDRSEHLWQFRERLKPSGKPKAEPLDMAAKVAAAREDLTRRGII